MPNWCVNKLIVIGPEEVVAVFEKEIQKHLEVADLKHSLSSREPGKMQVRFDYPWEPAREPVLGTSKRFPELTFLLAFWEIDMGFRGQLVIRKGQVLEGIHRCFGEEGYERYDQTHPLVDLFGNYFLEPKS